MSPNPAIIAHDAKNVLAALQGRLQLIRRRTISGSYDQDRALVDVDLALERLRILTAQIDELTVAAQRCAATNQDGLGAAWDGEQIHAGSMTRTSMPSNNPGQRKRRAGRDES